MTSFWWRHLNYVIKMTSQKFSTFKPPLSKVLVAPLDDNNNIRAMLLYL